MDKKDKHAEIEIWIKGGAVLISAIAFTFTILTWQEQGKIKRAEFLEKMIREFGDSSTVIARSILDGFAVCDPCLKNTAGMSDQEMIQLGSSRDTVPTDIELENLGVSLREKPPAINISRQRVRLSFDHLLDFFGKLEYYLKLDLMTVEEVNYFRYYIDKCREDDRIMTYANEHDVDLFLALDKRLDCECPNSLW